MSQSSSPLQHSRCGRRHRLAGLLAGTPLPRGWWPAWPMLNPPPMRRAPTTTAARSGGDTGAGRRGGGRGVQLCLLLLLQLSTLGGAMVGRPCRGCGFRRVPAVFSEPWRQLARLFTRRSRSVCWRACISPFLTPFTGAGRDLTNMAEAAALFEEGRRGGRGDVSGCVELVHRGNPGAAVSGGRQSYRITGTPTLIVNGKFRIDSRMANAKSAC